MNQEDKELILISVSIGLLMLLIGVLFGMYTQFNYTKEQLSQNNLSGFVYQDNAYQVLTKKIDRDIIMNEYMNITYNISGNSLIKIDEID